MFWGARITDTHDVLYSLQEGYGHAAGPWEETFILTREVKAGCPTTVPESRPGFLLAIGQDVRPGRREMGATDLGPTILYHLGAKIPRDLDGSVRLELFRPSFTEGRPITYGAQATPRGEPPTSPEEKRGLSKEDEELVKERLRALGYID